MYLSKSNVDLHTGQVYRWLDDADELNKIISETFDDAPLIKTFDDAESFIKTLDEDALGKLETGLLKVDEDLMDYFMASGRSSQKAIKSAPITPTSPVPKKLSDIEQTLDDEVAGVHRISEEDLKKIRAEDIEDLSPTQKELDELEIAARELDEITQVMTKGDIQESAKTSRALQRQQLINEDTAVIKPVKDFEKGSGGVGSN